MSKLFSNPITRRIVGAVAAGAATFVVGHDWKSAVVTAATFVIYGAAHQSVPAGDTSSK